MFIYQKCTKYCLAACQIDIGENENKLFNRMNFFQFKWKIVLWFIGVAFLRLSIKFICAVQFIILYWIASLEFVLGGSCTHFTEIVCTIGHLLILRKCWKGFSVYYKLLRRLEQIYLFWMLVKWSDVAAYRTFVSRIAYQFKQQFCDVNAHIIITMRTLIFFFWQNSEMYQSIRMGTDTKNIFYLSFRREN